MLTFAHRKNAHLKLIAVDIDSVAFCQGLMGGSAVWLRPEYQCRDKSKPVKQAKLGIETPAKATKKGAKGKPALAFMGRSIV